MNVLNECRVCFETTDQNLMVSPCHCRGSMAFIHLQCLKNCIEISGEEKCGICGQNWMGIEFVKKRKGFADFLNEDESELITLILEISTILLSILLLIINHLIIEPKIETNLRFKEAVEWSNTLALNFISLILFRCFVGLIKFIYWREDNFTVEVINFESIDKTNDK